MKKNTFLKEIQSLVNIISQGGEKLAFHSRSAFTSHNGPVTIAYGDPRDESYQKKAKAMAVHESFHKRYTDMRKAGSTAYQTKIDGTISNIIEDGRIEQIGALEFRGTKKVLQDGYNVLINEGFWSIPVSTGNPIKAFTSFLLFYIRGSWAEQEQFKPHLVAAIENVKKDLPMAIFVPIKALLDSRLPLLKSSVDVNELALDVVELLKKLQKEEEDKKNDDDSDGAGDSDSNDDSDSTSKDSAGNSGDEEDSDEIIDAIKKILDANDDELEDESLEQAIKDSLDKEAGDYESFFPANDVLGNSFNYDFNGGSVELHASSLKSKMRRLFESMTQTHVKAVKRGKRLISSKLHTVPSGNRNVFEKKTHKRGDNVAFSILVDKSISMNDLYYNGKTALKIANESAYALTKTLESIPGVECEVSYFGPEDGSNKAVNLVVKPFGVKSKASVFGQNTDGCTPLSENLLKVGERLLSRKEPRKILLVLTDGVPNNGEATDYAIESLKSEGVELMAIGILHEGVKDYFDNNSVIKQLSELPSSMFDMAKGALRL